MAQPTEGMTNFAEIMKDAVTEEFGEKHLNSLTSLTTALRTPDFRYHMSPRLTFNKGS